MGDDGLLIVWEFLVASELRDAFVRAYGREGPWVELFRRADGYRDSLLSEDRERPGRFLTLDVWESSAAYESFRQRFATEYAAIDQACEALTEREIPLGTFRLGPVPGPTSKGASIP